MFTCAGQSSSKWTTPKARKVRALFHKILIFLIVLNGGQDERFSKLKIVLPPVILSLSLSLSIQNQKIFLRVCFKFIWEIRCPEVEEEKKPTVMSDCRLEKSFQFLSSQLLSLLSILISLFCALADL